VRDIAVKVDGVSKRFRKGEQYDSLRDLIPALTGETFRRKTLSETDDREFWALEDVSFDVMKGEAFGIIGHNGAGKSTMLKVLSRIMQPTVGTVSVVGRLSALIEVSAGFHRDLTGRENIYLNGTILGMSRAEIDAKLDAIVDFSGLAEFIDTPVKRYSSGMFARLGFSVAAHVDPDVLIVDEVLSVGDFVFQQKCIARMREVIRRGTSVLFVSHNLRAIGELCTRGMLLDRGRVSEVGPIDSVISSYMTSARELSAEAAVGKPKITGVTISQNDREVFQVESGDSVYVDIDVATGEDCTSVAVVLYLTDEKNYEFFNTSTERLGYPAYDLQAGDTLRCRFKLDLNMAAGTYQAGAVLFRYHTQTIIDKPSPHCRFFVTSKSEGSRGIVDCNPSLVDSIVKSHDDADGKLEIRTGND
jgi:lipopolysaccharide transport system ATP-binding protein